VFEEEGGTRDDEGTVEETIKERELEEKYNIEA